MRHRSRAEQKAMFSRLSSYSDFNRKANSDFVKGIPSPREAVFTDKTMEVDKTLLGNLAPYNRKPFGVDIGDEVVTGDNNFSVDPDKFTRIINIEEALKHYDVNRKFYEKYNISKEDFLTVDSTKFDSYNNTNKVII